MNRRDFIKGSVMLLGLFAIDPKQFLSKVTSSDVWLDLYSKCPSPFMQMIDTSLGTVTINFPKPDHSWFKDGLRTFTIRSDGKDTIIRG